jgi:hypothetical protein
MKWPWLKAPSTSRVVFLMLSGTACIGFMTGKMDVKDFMILASMAFSYYFAIKTPGNTADTPTLPDNGGAIVTTREVLDGKLDTKQNP